MELADERQIALVMAASGLRERQKIPRSPRKSARSRLAAAPPMHKKNHPPCGCGTCTDCNENLRWERIFQAKFADPDYYARPGTRSGSPLNQC
jgi:hypothetical protein